MNVVVTCLLVSVSGDAQSPFPDAPGAHPDYDAFHFNNWLPERKDPSWKNFGCPTAVAGRGGPGGPSAGVSFVL